MKKNRNKFILKLNILLMFISCVGTVENKNPKTTKAALAKKQNLKFAGIESVVPISDSRVEVFFYPTDLDASTVTYEITYDGLQVPITIPALSLRPNYRGVLRYVVKGLDSNTTYNFQTELFNNEGLHSESGQIYSATTFDNLTAEFDGIGEVMNRSGSDGLDSIIVEWPLAKNIGTVASPAEIDVTEYSLTLIDADYLTPADMNNEFHSAPKRRIVQVASDKRSVIVNGLKSNTKYFIQVRAKHYGAITNSGNINYKNEVNTKYLEISTLSADLASYDFNLDGVRLTLPSGSAGLSSINIDWEAGDGAFDSYRIYYKKTNDPGNLNSHIGEVFCQGQEGVTDIYCKKVNFDITSTSIADLDSNTSYDLMVVLCQTSSCGNSERIKSNIVTIETTPSSALFNGVKSIEVARNLNEIDEIYLQIDPPNLANGILHGLLVEYQGPPAGSPTILNHPFDANLTELAVVDFPYISSTELTITGINPLSSDEYCFLVFPFTYDGVGGIIEHRGEELAKCVTPKIEAPSSLDFPGGSGCSVNALGDITVTWNTPTKGIYSHFDVFYNSGFFDFSTAVASYDKKTLNGNLTSTTLSSLASGSYSIGVLTYFNGLGVDKRSEFNSNIMNCVVP